MLAKIKYRPPPFSSLYFQTEGIEIGLIVVAILMLNSLEIIGDEVSQWNR